MELRHEDATGSMEDRGKIEAGHMLRESLFVCVPQAPQASTGDNWSLSERPALVPVKPCPSAQTVLTQALPGRSQPEQSQFSK